MRTEVFKSGVDPFWSCSKVPTRVKIYVGLYGALYFGNLFEIEKDQIIKKGKISLSLPFSTLSEEISVL